MIGARLQPRQTHPPQHLGDRPLMHDHPVTVGDHCAQVEAAPSGYPVDRQVGAGKHQSFQVLQLFRRQSRRTTAALGIAQPANAIMIVAVNPVAQRLTIHAARLGRFSSRPALEHQSYRQNPASQPTILAPRRQPAQLYRRQLQPRHFDLGTQPVLPRQTQIIGERESDKAAEGNPGRRRVKNCGRWYYTARR